MVERPYCSVSPGSSKIESKFGYYYLLNVMHAGNIRGVVLGAQFANICIFLLFLSLKYHCMRKILAGLTLLLAPLATYAQNPNAAADSAWLVTHYTKRDVTIPMRDGIKLYTAIYEPKAKGETHPILMNRTCYSIAPYGDGAFKNYWSSGYYMEYFRKGYIIVLQDVRGRYMSEGEFVDVRPYKENKKGKETDEASDTYDAIEWLLRHVADNNGKVGCFGISYPGYYATMAALSGHPALKAVSPQAPVTEWFLGDDFHHNGAFMMMDGFSFYSGFGKPRHGLIKSGPHGYQFPVKDNYQFYLNVGPLKNLAKLMGDSVTFWKEMYEHPNYDAWWKTRNTRNYVQHIPAGTATLVVGGLFDAEDCYGAWNLYRAIEMKAKNTNKLVMGPWSHGGWSKNPGEYLGNVRFGARNSDWYHKHIEGPFFDFHLRGIGSQKTIKEANVFFTGSNKWRTFEKWPPAGEHLQAIYLNENGALSWVPPAAAGSNKYTSDPARPVPYTEDVHFRRASEYMTDDQRFASRRPDVLVYQTDTLTKDVTLAGPVIADLFTSISTTDVDFVVKLIDVFPDNFEYKDSVNGKGNGKDYPMYGYQMLVRGEVMRGRYRNSFENPEAFTPGKVTEVRYTLPDVAHVFKKGHRIMVQVQSSWFPLVDRNPQQFVDIYKCDASDFVPCDVRIYTGKEYPSAILLPVLK